MFKKLSIKGPVSRNFNFFFFCGGGGGVLKSKECSRKEFSKIAKQHMRNNKQKIDTEGLGVRSIKTLKP